MDSTALTREIALLTLEVRKNESDLEKAKHDLQALERTLSDTKNKVSLTERTLNENRFKLEQYKRDEVRAQETEARRREY